VKYAVTKSLKPLFPDKAAIIMLITVTSTVAFSSMVVITAMDNAVPMKKGRRKLKYTKVKIPSGT